MEETKGADKEGSFLQAMCQMWTDPNMATGRPRTLWVWFKGSCSEPDPFRASSSDQDGPGSCPPSPAGKTDPPPDSSGPEWSVLGEPRAGAKSRLRDIREGFLKKGQQSYHLKDEKKSQKNMFMSVRGHHRSHFTDEELMLRKTKLLAQGHVGRKWQSASCPSLSVFPFSLRTNPKRSLGTWPHSAGSLSWSY